jgi:outer membrane protein OmpA-like peptidoglycan-associated protein
MFRKLILSTALAGVASALGGAAPGLAQDVGVFGEGPARLCNVVIDSAGNPVVDSSSVEAVRQNGTFDCPEEDEQLAAVVEPAAPPPLPDDGEVYFELDKYNLTTDAQAAINDMIFDIKDRELEGIRVVGHTDTSCPPGDNQAACAAYNQTLSERRAETVGQALVQQGIPVGLITTEGVGMNDLAVQTPPRTVNQQNRRAQIQVE